MGKLDVWKKAIEGGREFVDYAKTFGKESQAARKLIAKDPYNGSAAMASHYASIGTPITSYDVFNESGPALIKRKIYTPTIEIRKAPFFIDYADKTKAYRSPISEEYSKWLKSGAKDLRARNAYIQNVLGLKHLPDGTPLDGQTIANLLAEFEMNNGMLREMGTIKRKNYIPSSVNPNETKLIPKTQESPEYFIEVQGQGPQLNSEHVVEENPVKYKELYSKPEEIIGSISTPTVEKSNYTNNKLISKKERGNFGSTASYITGDNRHSNKGYSRVHRSQDNFDWETLKNYKEYKAEAHRLEVKEAKGQDVKQNKKALIEKYRKKYRSGNK